MARTAIYPKIPPQKSSLRYVDAGGDLASVANRCREMLESADAVHITHTNITSVEKFVPHLEALGFGVAEQYKLGGRTSAAWQQKWVAQGLRRMDYYPPHLYLLPNTEIQYRREFPARILFFCLSPAKQGGRVFLHPAKRLEQAIAAKGAAGEALLEKVSRHGLTIQTGFLSKHHPDKKKNHHQSWQERFGTDDKDAAIAAAGADRDEYDACWWEGDVLMTRITFNGFISRNGENYLRFPRIAMDGPAPHNGFRCYPLGNGVELTPDEKSLLRDVYNSTQDGFALKKGDVILMDNIRCGHSREPFTGEREVLVSMAGKERV